MPEIITRAEAKARGLKRYFTGKPCRRGHRSERWVAYPMCVKCSAIYNADWKKNNPDRQKQLRKASHERRRERDNAENRAWYARNKKKHKARNKRWAQQYPERMREYSRKHYRKNYEREKDRRKRHYWSNPEKQRARVQRFRYEGPLNPQGDSQWLSKAKAMNRLVKRVIRRPNLDHSNWLKPDLGI